MTGGRTGPGRERAIDPIRTRRRGELREQQTLEFPLVYRDGKIALLIDERSKPYIKVEPGRGLFLDLVATKVALDALP